MCVSEVLCFLSNNFDKLPASQLKPVPVSFYEDEELVDSKEQLLKAVQRAITDVGGDSEMPRLPRRQGEHKRKQTTDDLMKLFTIIDERNLTAALPYFTAGNLKRIPFVNADSVSVITMAKKLEILEQRMISVEQLLLTPTLQSIGSIDHESSTVHQPNVTRTTVQQMTSSSSVLMQLPVAPRSMELTPYQIRGNEKQFHIRKTDSSRIRQVFLLLMPTKLRT